ncbi:MAG: FYDLN acid domain-containing protein [Micavibrio sp.]
MTFKGEDNVATAIADKKGMKRICPGCSTRYYDFNKRPVLCPNCKLEFTGEIKLKARRSRAAANDVVEDQTDDTPIADKDDDAIIEGDDVVVSLDEVEEIEDEDVEEEETADPDLELDEDDLDDEDDEDDDLDEDDEDLEEDDDDDDSAKAKKKPAKKR